MPQHERVAGQPWVKDNVARVTPWKLSDHSFPKADHEKELRHLIFTKWSPLLMTAP